MTKGDRKKKRGFLKDHVGHMIRCSKCNRGFSVRFEGFTSEGLMRVTNVISGKTEVLPEEYLDENWKFG